MSAYPCIHFGDCGGCQLQQLNEPDYRASKQAVLEAMKERLGITAGIEWVWGGPGTRRRAEFKVNEKGELGFFAEGSHRVVPISQCPALEPELFAIVPALQALAAKQKGIEKIFVTAADSGIDVAVSGKGNIAPALITLTNDLKLARVTLNGTLVASLMPVRMNFGEWVELAPGGFLQPTRAGQKAISEIVERSIPKAKRIAEFFSGIGTYSFLLAKKAPVEAYEFSQDAVNALNKAAGGKAIKAHARDIEKFPVQPQELDGVDTAVLNPPRNGAGPQSKAIARSKVKRVVMVSCHPETLERDLQILMNAGFKVKEMVGIDQFHWTKHLETVVRLER